MKITRRAFHRGFVGASVFARAWAANRGSLFFVGTYTRTESKGIYAYRFDSETGQSAALGLAAEAQNPSFLVIHRNRRFLYAVNEIQGYEGKRSGSISAFLIDPLSAKLTLLNRVASQGETPAHCALDHSGKWLIAANYGSGSVVSFPVQPDGKLGEAVSVQQHAGSSVHPQRQQGPHPHQAVFSPDNRFVLVPDLGMDRVFTYAFDSSTAILKEASFTGLPGGFGPRHIAFDPKGKFAILVSELKSQLTIFGYDVPTGGLKEVKTISALQKPSEGANAAAEIMPLAGTPFWYASIRGTNSVGVFRFDPANHGQLTPAGEFGSGGKTPRHFAIDPGGRFLLSENQNSDRIAVFRIDRMSGRLTGTEGGFAISSPVCVAFLSGAGR